MSSHFEYRCHYVTDRDKWDEMDRPLREAGIPVAEETDRGRLEIAAGRSTFSRDEPFDEEAMEGLYREALERARDDGGERERGRFPDRGRDPPTPPPRHRPGDARKNGTELAEEVRKKLPGIRVLFMSGYSDERVGEEWIPEEEAEFIGKPFLPRDFVQRIREILDARVPPPPSGASVPFVPALSFRDFREFRAFRALGHLTVELS